jgi:phosphoserine phosphatase
MSIKFGFDDYIGSKYLTDLNKMYTGEVIPMWDSESKKNAINTFVERYNIDLSESYAYGDTAGDFTMLSMVNYPTAINPTKELLTKISNHPVLQKNINIIVERKDVIYNLNYNSINSF